MVIQAQTKQRAYCNECGVELVYTGTRIKNKEGQLGYEHACPNKECNCVYWAGHTYPRGFTITKDEPDLTYMGKNLRWLP